MNTSCTQKNYIEDTVLHYETNTDKFHTQYKCGHGVRFTLWDKHITYNNYTKINA